MSGATPIARSKSAALSRVTDSIPKGYVRYTSGVVKSARAVALANKLHKLHGIGCTPGQRITRKKHGKANAILVLFWPEGADQVHWLMLFTAGSLSSPEQLHDVTDRTRLAWLGYELVRHPNRGATSWTWRRPKTEMAEHYALLDEVLAKHHQGVVADTLARIANQPGFHGVREQSWALCQHALKKGYPGELPFLFYLQKLPHGEKLILD